MTELPKSDHLPIQHLAGVFNNVTNSYKFYWFLAILEAVQDRHNHSIPIQTLLYKMIANVWYPAHYFRLSFGKQDKLNDCVALLAQESNLPTNASRDELIHAIKDAPSGSKFSTELRRRARFVPYRFLRPFFASELRGVPDHQANRRIETLAAQSFDHAKPPIYRFSDASIEIHPKWFEYLVIHLNVLRGFCLWHLVNYLQKNNPNVPGLATKLFPPEERDLAVARKFWQAAISRLGPLTCIYSKAQISERNMSLDHFLPWSFVAHDLLWNIIPTTDSINSAKGDRLPSLDKYLRPYAQLQFRALRSVAAVARRDRLFEDYVLLLKVASLDELTALDEKRFTKTIEDTVRPQYQIARNLGFEGDWEYRVAP